MVHKLSKKPYVANWRSSGTLAKQLSRVALFLVVAALGAFKRCNLETMLFKQSHRRVGKLGTYSMTRSIRFRIFSFCFECFLVDLMTITLVEKKLVSEDDPKSSGLNTRNSQLLGECSIGFRLSIVQSNIRKAIFVSIQFDLLYLVKYWSLS